MYMALFSRHTIYLCSLAIDSILFDNTQFTNAYLHLIYYFI